MFYNLLLTHQRVPSCTPLRVFQRILSWLSWMLWKGSQSMGPGASKSFLSLLWYQQDGDWEETLQTLPASSSLEWAECSAAKFTISSFFLFAMSAESSGLMFNLLFLHHSSARHFCLQQNVTELPWSKGFTQSQICWKRTDLTFPSLTISETSNKHELRAIRCFADTVQSGLQVEQISLLRWRSLFIKALFEEFCFISPATVF